MFKLLKWAVILVVLVIVGAVVALYLGLGVIVKKVVVTEGNAQLNVPTTLGSASVGLLSGSVGFKDFALGSPPGFTAPQMLSVGGLTVATTGVTHLRDNPIHVTNIQVDAPHLVIEQKGLKINIKEFIKNLPGGGEGTEPKKGGTPAEQNPTKLIIDTLSINSPVVDFIPDAGGLAGGAASHALGALGNVGDAASALAQKGAGNALKPQTFNLSSLTVKDIGNADGKGRGAPVKDVAVAIVQAIAAEAAKQENLPFNPALLTGDTSSVREGIQDQIKNKLPGGAGGLLDKALGGGK